MRIKYPTTLNENLKGAYRHVFTDYVPRRLEYAFDNNLNQEIKEIYNQLDFVDFHYRHYVSGTHKTLHRVLYEVREIRKCPFFNDSLLFEMMNLIGDEILTNELYEFMPRHLYAKDKILDLLML